MKKGILTYLLLFSAGFLQAALPGVKIEMGPYLQAVTETGFTVVWASDTDAVAWVEVAPDDGSDFYAAEISVVCAARGCDLLFPILCITFTLSIPKTTRRYP